MLSFWTKLLTLTFLINLRCGSITLRYKQENRGSGHLLYREMKNRTLYCNPKSPSNDLNQEEMENFPAVSHAGFGLD